MDKEDQGLKIKSQTTVTLIRNMHISRMILGLKLYMKSFEEMGKHQRKALDAAIEKKQAVSPTSTVRDIIRHYLSLVDLLEILEKLHQGESH